MTEWVTLEQGSAEWLAYRTNKFNASEAGAVMGVNPWLPKNPAQLYDIKTGAMQVKVNAAMQNGIDTEPAARAYAERYLKDDLTPLVACKGRYSASLDGVNFDATLAVEIKCPQSTESKLFDLVTPNAIRTLAPNYWWQIVHQFYVVNSLKQLAFVVYHPDKQNFVMINRDEVIGFFDQLCAAWEHFGEALDSQKRPEEEECDDSEEFGQLAHAYRVQKLKVEAAEAELAAINEEIKAYAKRSGKTQVKGFNVTVSLVTRQGNVDYKKIPELKGVDLDKYRGKPSTYYMVKTT